MTRWAIERRAHAWLLLATVLAMRPAIAAEFDCMIEPRRTVEIRSSVQGLIEKVFVDRGDIVKEGQVLATLDSGLERATADLAKFRSTMQGSVKSGESRVEFATQKLERREQLYKQKFTSGHDRDEAQTEKRLAESQLLEAQDNQRIAELEYKRATEQLRLRTLRSPVNGVVIERLMHPGELADTGDIRKPLMRIADIDVLHIEALLPVEAYGSVEPGQVAEVIPEARIGGRFEAKVTVVDRVLDAPSGTFGVRLSLANKKMNLPAGVKCTVDFKRIPGSVGREPTKASK